MMGKTRKTGANARRGSPADHRLEQALGAHGQRFTEQRAVVYRYLMGTNSHPTANEVYAAVRSELRDISLATVYKALETLVACSLAQKLTYGDGSARYDGRTDEHCHARCVECGAVIDVPIELDLDQLSSQTQISGFHIEGLRLELVGRCNHC